MELFLFITTVISFTLFIVFFTLNLHKKIKLENMKEDMKNLYRILQEKSKYSN